MTLRSEVRIALAAFIAWNAAFSAPSAEGQASGDSFVLPPVDASAGLTEAQRQVDEAVTRRIQELESALANLESELATADTEGRFKLLEDKVALLETRNQAERARALGSARSRYTDGYKLLSDMQIKADGLLALASAVAAYNSLVDLTDLRQYSGFSESFDDLVGRVRNRDERSFLSGLLSSVAPKLTAGTTTLAGIHPLVSAATLALNQVTDLIPIVAKDRLEGGEFVRTYQGLTCGLRTVGELHDNLTALVVLNAQWSEDLTALKRTYPSMLQRYRALVGAPAGGSDAQFYSVVERRFNTEGQGSAESFLNFSDEIAKQNGEFELAARAYHAAVLKHLEFWERTKQVIATQRGSECLRLDTATQARYTQAVARIDTVIRDVRDAYLFGSESVSEYEYFRILTQK